jgi:hypothetical protein
MSGSLIAPRTPWRANFPPVVGQCNYRFMHDHPSYRLAKDGENDEAALSLIYDCISDRSMEAIQRAIGGCVPRVVAVHAEEATGRNKIPMAYGEVLAAYLGLDTDPGIVQATVANHGGAASIYHRMVSQPTFQGYVEAGAHYLIVDDTCTAGGTLANLKGYIEVNGGIVAAMSVLSGRWSDTLYDISLAPGTLSRLKYRHSRLNKLWQEEFSNGIETLTEGEAGHLFVAPSVDTIRNRLAEARRDLHLDGDEGAHDAAPKTPGQDDHTTPSPAQDAQGC